MNKVKLEIKMNIIGSERLVKVMSYVDPTICGIEAPQTWIINYTTTTKVDAEYIKRVKRIYKKEAEKEGYKVISII